METPLLARPRSLAAALGAVVLAGALLTQPGSAAATDGPTDPSPGPTVDQPTVSESATEQALGVLEQAGAAVSGDAAAVDTSLALLQLAQAESALPTARRAEAARILARPTDGDADPQGFGYGVGALPTQACQGGFCVHWARASADAPDLTDANGNGTPDYVDRVFATLTKVAGTYAKAGYRKPVADGTRGGGGSDQFDVYLVDSGTRGPGVYGYCAPENVSRTSRSASSFCALDNDFAEFPTHTPTENMQVTVAHEYFHAVQFAYDIWDDIWFLEATAAWVEDEMFDSVNDNVQYLRSSPIGQPMVPADKGKGIRVYGSWILFRYLSELEPKSKAGLPTIIRDIWRKAAGPAYSIQAVQQVLKSRHRNFTTTLATFADANRNPKRRYAEGRQYPTAKAVESATIAAGRGARATLQVDHLASGTYQFAPGAGTAGGGTRLRVVVDLPDAARAPAAVVTVALSSGKLRTRLVKLTSSGAGRLTVPFSSRTVDHVDVTLVNASTRYTCERGTPYSCGGKAKDDNAPMKVEVHAVR